MNSLLPFYLHKAGAGFPSPATDYIEEDIDLNIHLIKNAPATFVIRVQGKSMSNVGIYDGDLLIIDKYFHEKELIKKRVGFVNFVVGGKTHAITLNKKPDAIMKTSNNETCFKPKL